MVTKIKPRRIKSDNPGSLGDFLGYQDESIFQWGQGGGGQVYTAGRGIEIENNEINARVGTGLTIGDYQDYSAIKGPCPEGFHIPTYNEVLTLNSMCSTLGTTFSTHLFFPYNIHNIKNDGTQEAAIRSMYWTCEKSVQEYSATVLHINGSAQQPSSSLMLCSCGIAIRPFKDVTEIPNSNWTTIFDGSNIANNAGVFYNSDLGILSISSDGVNRITIADKNVGATQVYHDGDTLSDANRGLYYQFGNNYGFSWNGGYTTSSTKVDTTGYGPGNYYYDDVFITTGDGERWSSVENPDIWGGVTGVVTQTNIILNTGVLSVNGQTGDITIPTAEESNTKTFYLSSTSDLTTVQAAVDWIIAGKTAFILFNGAVYKQRDRNTSGSNERFFFSTDDNSTVQNTNLGNTVIKHLELQINADEITHIVSTISTSEKYLGKYINIDGSYSEAFIPTQDYHPATKKYVDDGDTKIASTAPSNPIEGMLWYDTTNNILKSYDGANWNDIGITYSAGTGINIDANNEITNTGVLSVNSNTGAINLKTINNTSIIGTGNIVTPITTVEDNLTSTSTTNALSANQGRILDGKIADLMALGKFLSLWNAATGQPISFPYTTPYAYSTGDYFLVEVVDVTANYRPDGSSYIGTASSTVETDELEQGDVYIYDGSVWLLQSNHGKTASFANITGQPTDNINLATALGQKQDNLAAGTGISISSNIVTNTGVTSFNGSTGAVTYTAPVTSVNGQTGVVTIPEALIYVHTGGISQGDNITSIITALTNGKTVVIEEGGLYYLVTYWDDTSYEIEASTLGGIGQALFLSITYDNSGICQSISIGNRELGGIQNDTTGTTTTVTKIRAGTEAEYNALSTHDANTIYHIY